MKLSIFVACTLCLVTLNCLVSLAISDQDWLNAVRTHYKTYGIDTPPPEPQNSEMQRQLNTFDSQLAHLRRTGTGTWQDFFKIYMAKAEVYLSYRQYSGALLYCNAAIYLLNESLSTEAARPYRISVLETKLQCLNSLHRYGEARQVYNKIVQLRAQEAARSPATHQSLASAESISPETRPSLGTAQSASYMLPLFKREAEGGSAEALAWLEGHAKNGNKDAMRALGELFLEGRGVTKDEMRAMTWFQAACLAGDQQALQQLRELAENGNSAAQYTIAQFYAEGTCLPQSIPHAVKFAALAAAQSHTQALAWLEAQANLTNHHAQLALADLYRSGRGVPKDESRAWAYYHAACTAGDQRALESVLKIADRGDATAQCLLGQAFAEGTYGTRDPERAVKYFALAAAQSHTQALAWLEAQANLTNHHAQLALADLYRTGRGVPKDESRAWAYYHAACIAGDQCALESVLKIADSGDAIAQCLLGQAFAEGTYGTRDPERAVKYFALAAAQSHTQALAWLEAQANLTNHHAQLALADLYRTGRGVPQNQLRALSLYESACLAGSMPAFDAIRQEAQRGNAEAQYLAATLMTSALRTRFSYTDALK